MKNYLIFLLFCIGLNITYAKPKITTVTGEGAILKDLDTVSITLFPYGQFPGSEGTDGLSFTYKTVIRNHKFSFRLPITYNRPVEFSMEVPTYQFNDTSWLLINQGDRLNFHFEDGLNSTVDGMGSSKISLQRQINKMYAIGNFDYSDKSKFEASVKNSYERYFSIKNFLQSHKKFLDDKTFRILSIHAAQALFASTRLVESYYRGRKDSADVHNELSTYLRPAELKAKIRLDTNAELYSGMGPKYILLRYGLDLLIDDHFANLRTVSDNLKLQYLYIKNHFKGLLKEKLITYVILDHPKSNDLAFCYNDAISSITNKSFKAVLNLRCTQLPGEPAYNFSLPDSNNVYHRLSDFRGKVVVLDFWFTGCGNCRLLTPKLKLVEDQFKGNRNVVFVSISCDFSRDMWKKSLKGGKYTTSEAEVNFYTAGKGMSDSLYQKINFQSAPTLRLVGKNGEWCENPVDCRADDGKDLIAKINKALGN